MSNIPKPMTLADPKRFKTIQDLTLLRPDCGASIDDIFVIENEFLLIVDLAHIGSILNPYNSPSASYVRTHGVIVASYTHTESCPIFWSDPFLLLPLSRHLKKNFNGYIDVANIVGSVSCPSGSFLMLPLQEDMPAPLNKGLDDALGSGTVVKINVPKGTYRVFYEQHEAPEAAKEECYRNIVVQKQ